MDNFVFQNATKILFGKNTETAIGKETARYAKKVLLHYGQSSVKQSGLLDRVIASLASEGISIVELGGVQPNPRLNLVYEGIDLCRKNKIDFIVALGGGSVIDSAKAIAAGVPYEGDVWDFFSNKASPKAALMVATILTIPAAGSETSGSTVITRDQDQLKRGLTSDEFLRPVFSILNPELTKTLSIENTAIGAADIMSHVMERYFTNTKHVDYSDHLCEATMKSLIKNLPLVLKDPLNYDLRAELMWIGTNAHSDLIGMGRVGDWASHMIEHELSGVYDIKHGAGLAIVFPAWMKFVYAHDKARFSQFAQRVWDVPADFGSIDQICLEGIRRIEAFYTSVGLPTRLSHLKIDQSHFDQMARQACGSSKIGSFVPLGADEVKKIYEKAL